MSVCVYLFVHFWLCLCVCVCLFVYICLCISVSACLFVYICLCISVCVHVCLFMSVLFVYICVCMSVCVCLFVRVYFCMSVCKVDDYTPAIKTWDIAPSADSRLDSPRFIYFGRNGNIIKLNN